MPHEFTGAPILLKIAAPFDGYYLQKDLLKGNLDNNTLHGFMLSANCDTSIDYPNARETEIYGINDSGQIVRMYLDQSLIGHDFLATPGSYPFPAPIRAPTTMLLLGLGVGKGQEKVQELNSI